MSYLRLDKLERKIDSNKNASDLVMVLSTKNQIYAEMVKNALDTEGIPSLLKSPTGSYLRGMLPISQGFFDFRLYVQNTHYIRAGELVETIVPAEEL